MALFLNSCAGLNSGARQIGEDDYRIYTREGKPSSFADLLVAIRDVDVTFLGEVHDDPVAHYLEALILKESWEPTLALSLEMFETDVQYVLDEYLAGQIREDHMTISARAWSGYETDYKPMVEFMKEKQGTVVAANPPRRYVNMVTRLGPDSLEALSDQAKTFLPPLPYAEASRPYAEKFNSLMEDSIEVSAEENSVVRESSSIAPIEMSTEALQEEQEKEERLVRILQAQSLWDAGMAWSIASHLAANSEDRVLHVNGGFHSAEHMGILDHLSRYRAETSMLVVAMIVTDEFPDFNHTEMQGQGDFVIVTKSR